MVVIKLGKKDEGQLLMQYCWEILLKFSKRLEISQISPSALNESKYENSSILLKNLRASVSQ